MTKGKLEDGLEDKITSRHIKFTDYAINKFQITDKEWGEVKGKYITIKFINSGVKGQKIFQYKQTRKKYFVQQIWFDDNFVGTELNPELSYAKVAVACGLKGVAVRAMEETTAAIKQSCEVQKKGITTFIEVILNQELGKSFRRDAMKKPVKVAGIKKEDMIKQPSLVS